MSQLSFFLKQLQSSPAVCRPVYIHPPQLRSVGGGGGGGFWPDPTRSFSLCGALIKHHRTSLVTRRTQHTPSSTQPLLLSAAANSFHASCQCRISSLSMCAFNIHVLLNRHTVSAFTTQQSNNFKIENPTSQTQQSLYNSLCIVI